MFNQKYSDEKRILSEDKNSSLFERDHDFKNQLIFPHIKREFGFYNVTHLVSI